MGVVNFMENTLTRFSKYVRRNLVKYSEYRNIRRKKNLINKVQLSEAQEKEIKEFFKQHYGKSISTDWHRLYQSYTGIYQKDYFPEILFSTELEPLLNPYKIASFLGDKNLLPLLFSGIDNLIIPTTYASCISGTYKDGFGNIITKDRLNAVLGNIGNCVIKKTIDTNSGKDVQICNFSNGIDTKSSKSLVKILSAFGDNFVVQELIHQHTALATLNPTSVNTFRVITYILDGNVFVCPVALRLGRASSDRDNIHYGGIVIGVTEDGKLKPTAFSEYGECFDKHPDTQITFAGYSLPIMAMGGGNELIINRVAREAHSRIPWLGILSFDLTIDRNGKVVLLEVNTIGQSAWFCQMVNGKSLFGENTGKILNMIRK